MLKTKMTQTYICVRVVSFGIPTNSIATLKHIILNLKVFESIFSVSCDTRFCIAFCAFRIRQGKLDGQNKVDTL